MTFMKGVTTWALLRDKIVDLATGVGVDDFGVGASTGDRWRRMDPNEPFIAPPATTDTALSLEQRAGYWMRVDDTCLYASDVVAVGAATYVRTSALVTGTWGASAREMVIFSVVITKSNTTPGDYSTAIVFLKAFGASTLDSYGAMINTSGIPNAAGVVTITGGGLTFTVQVGDPTGTLALNAVFYRAFTDEYRGGIDNWKGFGEATTSPTFSVAPPGVLGTDYAPVRYGLHWPSGVSTSYFTYPAYPSSGTTHLIAPGHGLGIKSQAALTGGRYVVEYSKNDAMGSVLYAADTPSSSYFLTYAFGGIGLSPSGLMQYGIEGSNGAFNGPSGASNVRRAPAFVRPFSSPPSASARVEYWLSVTPEHLALSVNGETGYSGLESQNMVAKIQMADPTGPQNWFLGGVDPLVTGADKKWVRLGVHPLIGKVLKKGLRDADRDWQTGVGRYDYIGVPMAGWSAAFGEYSIQYFLVSDYPSEVAGLNASYMQTAIPGTTDRLTTPVRGVSEWLMAGAALLSGPGATSTDVSWAGMMRPEGYVDHGLLYTSKSGFSNGDELTDTSTGKKYLLWLGSSRSGIAGATFGVAMEEV